MTKLAHFCIIAPHVSIPTGGSRKLNLVSWTVLYTFLDFYGDLYRSVAAKEYNLAIFNHLATMYKHL